MSSKPPNGITTRRDVLQAAGAGALASVTAPIVHAADKSGTRPPILGRGRHRYEALHDWGHLPTRLKWGDTHGVCFDEKGRVYIIHTVHPSSESADGVVVFDPDGKFITSWGKEFRGGGHGIEIRKEGNDEFLYCCDVNRKVFEKRSLTGDIIWTRGHPVEAGVYPDGKGWNPTNIAFAPDGGFYVADGYGSSYIHRYDKDGDWVSTFGGKGAEPGKTNCPHGIMVDHRGKEPAIVVADRANRRLQYFTLDGKHIRFVTDELRLPCHFDVHDDVLLIPDLESRVTLFDKQNKLITHLGGSEKLDRLRGARREQFPPGEFVHPHGCRFDRNGNIFITEWVQVGRITKLRRLT
jgi:sugar lactone lactonase YvrE